MWADALEDNIAHVDFNGRKRSVIVQYAPHPFGLTMFESNIFWTDWYNKSVYRAHRVTRGFSPPTEVRDSLSGALDIRAVSLKRQSEEWNQCAQDNGGCTHLCLFRGHDYVCACPDKADRIECTTTPKFLVPSRSGEPHDYAEDVTEGDSGSAEDDDDDDLHGSRKSKHQNFWLIATIVAAFLLICTISIILALMVNSKRNKPKRHSRGSSRSVLTFSNPNYNVDGTPMEPKTTIWKRFKYDRSHERVYEERSLTTETASSSLFVPTPSPMASPSTKNIQLTTLSTIT